MVKLRKLRALCSLGLALLGCGQDTNPITQLVLVADTDIQSLDNVEFVIASEAEGSRSAEASRVGQTGPSFLSVVHDQGPLGPVTVSARGMRSGAVIVQRSQRVSFVQDQTRVVPLHLFSSCVGVVCAADQTCSELGCTSQTLPEDALPSWTGQPPRAPGQHTPDAGTATDAGIDAGSDVGDDAGSHPMDAGAPPHDGGRTPRDAELDGASEDAQVSPQDAGADAGDAAARDAATAAGDAATPKLTQCGDGGLFDLQSDINHCGKCGKVCKLDGTEQCSVGVCVKK